VQSTSSTALPAFFLPAKSINTAVVIVAVDLSRPATALTDAEVWIQCTLNALNAQYQLLERRGSSLPSQLKACVYGAIVCMQAASSMLVMVTTAMLIAICSVAETTTLRLTPLGQLCCTALCRRHACRHQRHAKSALLYRHARPECPRQRLQHRLAMLSRLATLASK
jgi:hypothetical protein